MKNVSKIINHNYVFMNLLTYYRMLIYDNSQMPASSFSLARKGY